MERIWSELEHYFLQKSLSEVKPLLNKISRQLQRRFAAAQATNNDDKKDELTDTVAFDGVTTGDDDDVTVLFGKLTPADVAIAANQKLLNVISKCDYQTYKEPGAKDDDVDLWKKFPQVLF